MVNLTTKTEKVKNPSIVLLDIETAPITGYTWGTYEQTVLKVLEPSKILSIAWKGLGDNETKVKAICDYKGYTKGIVDDEALVREAWGILDKADVVIGHHSNKFDLPKLNARFVWYGLAAPSSYKSVDTKAAASRYFKFDANSLNALCQYFGIGKKFENGGFELWVRCIAGDKSAWDTMKKYNKQDVVLLEQLYLKIRPYIENHPSMSVLTGKLDACPTCLSHDVQKRGFSITKTGRKQRYQCNSCGSWSSGTWKKTKDVLV